jgi:hypothetical protein
LVEGSGVLREYRLKRSALAYNSKL